MAASLSVPPSSKTLLARATISRPPVHSCTPSVRITGSHALWLMIVPKGPGEAPMMAMRRPPNTRRASVLGRDSQSMVFLNTPGMPLLYSGVTSSTPSADTIASFSWLTLAGMPCASMSPS